ncbi:hypothetical protein FBY31_3247 [Arthrobacter sp. SLBN-100]|uniref:hypothetical protein n=1 Tax=Arthrobacter sp. SLBN-100 TaxID=2768450 RepID=UPI001152555B|nr:hypothetical protein [Arthrobacter sp. SLBN-100]TQJ69119.1 hypothetical protein FBY31_3247 [Arthrobacter sp. SLBN-100]
MEQPAGTIGFREVDRDGNPVVDEDHAAAEDQSSRWLTAAINPFIVALWAVAAVLVGGIIFAFLTTSLAVGPSSGSMPASFVIFTFAPYAVLSGTITVICLLFWHALQWQRRFARHR